MKKHVSTKLTILLCILSIMLFCFGIAACGTKTYKVTLDYNSEQGSVELSPAAENNEYEKGTELTVTVTPNSGYALDTFKLSTEDKNATPDDAGRFVFKVEEDTTITVTFKSTEPTTDKFTLTVPATVENGKIDVSPAADAEGKYDKNTEITVTLTPDADYEVDTFTVGGEDKKAELQNNVYKFNITADTEITASFKSTYVPVQSVSIVYEKDTLTLEYSETAGAKVKEASLSVKIEPGNATYESIEWTTDETTVVTVDNNGKVTAIGVGSDTIVVKVDDEEAWISVMVVAHTHNYGESYRSTSDSQHTATCESCDYVLTENHNTKLVSDGEVGHHTECTLCEYETATVEHGELELSSEAASNLYHHLVCKDGCGYSVEKQHSMVVKTSSAEHWLQCSVCDCEGRHDAHVLQYKLSADGTKHIAYCNENCAASSQKCNYEAEEAEHVALEGFFIKDDDATNHYTKCKDCETLYNPVAHSGSGFTVKDGDADNHYHLCEGCQQAYGEAIAHSGTEYAQKSGDDDHHYTKCKDCETLFDPQEHVLSYTDKDDSVHSVACSVCKKTFPDEQHEIDGAACKCGHQVGTHTLVVDANGYTDGSCSCGKENLLFTVDATGMILTVKADAEHTKIKIPAEINGIAVKTISAASSGNMGFRGNTTITDIIVPVTITSLPNSAFNGCSSLVSAVILADIAELPQQCFHNCKSLSALVLSASITTIHKNAFGISDKTIPTTLKTIYYVGTQNAWDALMDKVNTDNGKAKTVLDGVSNVYIYSPTNEAGKWHWKDGAENMIPVLWD